MNKVQGGAKTTMNSEQKCILDRRQLLREAYR